MRACPGRGMYVCGKRVLPFFALLDSFLWPHGLRPCCRRKDRMDLIPGNLSRMIFHRFDLPLPVFRGSKGPIKEKLTLQQLRRPYRIHTPLVSANAVIMWCMECVWISYRMRLLDRAPVCMGGEVFFANSVFGTCFSLESSGWLRGCRAGSRSGRLCMNASIAVPRGGAWSASHPWSPNLT